MILRKDTRVKDFNNRTVYDNTSEEYFNIYNPECCNCCKYGSGCICGLNEAIEHAGIFIIVDTIFGNKEEIESRMRYFDNE